MVKKLKIWNETIIIENIICKQSPTKKFFKINDNEICLFDFPLFRIEVNAKPKMVTNVKYDIKIKREIIK